jgi:glycosyltransferase involved in cell wall biosynthesis
METIRVAWLNQFDPLNPWAGGAERHIAEISTRLVEAGHEVTVFAERYLNSTREESLGGVRIVRPAGRLGMHLWAAESFRGSQPFDIIVRDLSKVLPWGPTSGWRIPSLAIVRHLNGSVLVNEVPLAAPALWTVERAYGRLLRDVLVVTEARATARRLVAIGIPPSHITLLKP